MFCNKCFEFHSADCPKNQPLPPPVYDKYCHRCMQNHGLWEGCNNGRCNSCGKYYCSGSCTYINYKCNICGYIHINTLYCPNQIYRQNSGMQFNKSYNSSYENVLKKSGPMCSDFSNHWVLG